MSDLICLAFKELDTADHFLNELRALQKEYVLELEDACVVVRDGDGKIHLKQSVNLVVIGASQGASLGMLALVKVAMGNDGRLLGSLPGLGYVGVVIEGMGAGHVPADVAPIVGDLAAKIPVVLASRAMTGHVFTRTYGYPGSEIDLIKRGVVPAGYRLSSRLKRASAR